MEIEFHKNEKKEIDIEKKNIEQLFACHYGGSDMELLEYKKENTNKNVNQYAIKIYKFSEKDKTKIFGFDSINVQNWNDEECGIKIENENEDKNIIIYHKKINTFMSIFLM